MFSKSRPTFGILEKRVTEHPLASQMSLSPYFEWTLQDDGTGARVRITGERSSKQSIQKQYPYLTDGEIGRLWDLLRRTRLIERYDPEICRKVGYPFDGEYEPMEPYSLVEYEWLFTLTYATSVNGQVSYRDTILQPYVLPLRPVKVYTAYQVHIAWSYMFEQCMAWRNDRRDPNLARKADPTRYHGPVHTVEEWAKIHTQVRDPNYLPSNEKSVPRAPCAPRPRLPPNYEETLPPVSQSQAPPNYEESVPHVPQRQPPSSHEENVPRPQARPEYEFVPRNSSLKDDLIMSSTFLCSVM
ncbi:hypothetical protein MMC25_007140 [Agyrium rufum]|nr:hypothetical protein [Agyrium rufum]